MAATNPHYTHVVIEHYRDGGTWTHWYTSQQMAEWGVEDMQEAHKGRKYEIKLRPDTIEDVLGGQFFDVSRSV